ncbi:hypothetical protein EPN83_02385 [Patescibacteria group bacterium]|nr:MAG: hypothetical protein EPN83_02385 [Patescibacteria group bacterium]
MKTNYLLPNRRRSLPRRALLAALVFLLLLFLLEAFAPVALFQIIRPVAEPLFRLRDILNSGMQSVGSFFVSKHKLAGENLALERRVENLESELLALQSVAEEEERLLAEWGRKVTKGGVLGRVLLKPYQSPYDTLLIDAGVREGAVVGARVVSRGIVLGEVAEVYTHSSKVKLYSSPGETLFAELLGSGLTLELKGKGAGNFSASLPSDVAVKVNDIAVIPQLTSLPLARVAAVESKPTESFKAIYLRSPVNIFELQWVEILLP